MWISLEDSRRFDCFDPMIPTPRSVRTRTGSDCRGTHNSQGTGPVKCLLKRIGPEKSIRGTPYNATVCQRWFRVV